MDGHMIVVIDCYATVKDLRNIFPFRIILLNNKYTAASELYACT